MPRGRPGPHDTSTCACCARPNPAAQVMIGPADGARLLLGAPRPLLQGIEELDFQRSACAAAQAGDEAKLARILHKHPQAVHQDGSSGAAPYGALGCHPPARHPDRSPAGASGYTPLHYAAREGHASLVRLLLAAGECLKGCCWLEVQS